MWVQVTSLLSFERESDGDSCIVVGLIWIVVNLDASITKTKPGQKGRSTTSFSLLLVIIEVIHRNVPKDAA